MARRRSTSRTRTANAARRSAAARKGWQTRRANAAKRSAAARKGWQTRKKHERKQKRDRFKLKRERDRRRAGATSFDFGANVMPAPIERATLARTRRADDDESEPDVIEDLDDFIEEYDDAEDFDEIDIEATPSYKDRGK